MAGVVITVDTERLPAGRVGVLMKGHAPAGPAMRAQLAPVPRARQAAAAAGPAGLLRGMHQSERWGGEAGEYQRVGGDGVGDAFDAAGGAGHQYMPDIAFVFMGAGRADRCPSVPAADVGD